MSPHRVLPSLVSGRAYCAACDTGGKDELVFVRIVRPREGHARLAVAAGFHRGARPAALAPSQRDLFSALTHRGFAGVLEQAAHAGCQVFVCGGGLFADPLPSLDHVRLAMAPLGSARRAGITIIATREQTDQATEGTSFLAEVGLIDTVLEAHRPDSVLVSAADSQIALLTGGARGDFDATDLILALDAPGGDSAEPASHSGFVDMVVSTRAATAGAERLDNTPLIETGWAGPSLDRETQPGFLILDIDPDAGLVPTFVETEALRPARMVIDSPRAGSDVSRQVAPELGRAGILDVDLRGRISRSVWHEMDAAGLIERAAAEGTLLRFALEQLVVEGFDGDSRSPERASFLVNTRRVSEGLAAAADDESQREMIAAARARVVEIARRREPTAVVT